MTPGADRGAVGLTQIRVNGPGTRWRSQNRHPGAELLPGATGVVTFLPQVDAEVKQVMAPLYSSGP
jgi:hypothetical protein